MQQQPMQQQPMQQQPMQQQPMQQQPMQQQNNPTMYSRPSHKLVKPQIMIFDDATY